MSTRTTYKLKCLSVMEVVESSSNFEDTIKPSDEFLQVFKLTRSCKDQSNFKKQMRTIEIKMDKLFLKVINSQDTKFEDIITLAYSCHHLCFAYIKSDQTKKLSAAKDSILRCLHFIKDKEVDPKIILLTLKAYNLLSHIYQKQQKLENAIEALDKAIDLYLIYMEEHSKYDIPIDYEDIIIKPSEQINGYIKLKCLYMHILQTSTDIHLKMKSKANESFMLSRHLLLIEKLNCLLTTEEYVQWIEKATTVCNYLIMGNRFAEAKNYLEKLYFIQKALHAKYFDTLEKGLPSQTSMLLNQSAFTFKLVISCYVRNNITLFYQSVKRLLRLETNQHSEADNSIIKELKSVGRASRRLLIFYPDMKENFDNTYHATRFAYILKYNEALKQFIDIVRIIYNSKLHLNFVGDVKLCIRCRLYISNAYKYMAFYEKDTATQFLLRKGGAETLEEVANVLGDRNDCKLLRLLWLQLSIAYSTLIDMKLDDIEASYLPYLPQSYFALEIDEINILVAKSSIFLQKYMCSK
ncbi:uncharacterized protein LOC116840310 [Odontomachus brunneus]|uniref:uncharacterized protein LOC116840310 n=1 Tax=Odontomachus brunneus TaxID=486640 RepID=UPI0013F1A8FA|nr:uncharacterized protein LOC116840310 [Odontomachus brunneus]